jgi:uncharacterized protein
VLVLLAVDLARPAPRQLSARLLLAGIGWYRSTLSPVARAMGVRCRFEPSCSRYGAAVIAEDGALIGVVRTLWRIGRCGPWTQAGTHDPP